MNNWNSFVFWTMTGLKDTDIGISALFYFFPKINRLSFFMRITYYQNVKYIEILLSTAIEECLNFQKIFFLLSYLEQCFSFTCYKRWHGWYFSIQFSCLSLLSTSLVLLSILMCVIFIFSQRHFFSKFCITCLVVFHNENDSFQGLLINNNGLYSDKLAVSNYEWL